MAIVEIGRFNRNEAHILIGRLDAEGIPAFALDGIPASPTAATCSSRCG